MIRDPQAPIPELPIRIPRSDCGYALEENGAAHCGAPAIYTFRVKSWPPQRTGSACPEHAQIVRRWDLEYMRSLAVAS